MFQIRLVVKKFPDRWVFRVGWVFRAVNGLLAALMIVAGIVAGTYIVPVILALVAGFAALYVETATFDKAKRRVEFRNGLAVFAKVRTFTLEEVAEVRFQSMGKSRFVGLEIGLTDGMTLTIETDRGKAANERLSHWAEDLSGWLGVPLVKLT